MAAVRSLQEPPAVEPRTPWRSIFIVSTFTFCTAAQFTLYFSSLFPFLQLLDPDASENFYGLIIAIYSLGQLLSGPVVGWWSNRTKSIVAPAQACLLLTLVGNVVYFLAALLPAGQKWGVLAARFFVGLGESSLSLYQGFASTASTAADRSRALSITTGGLALGFCVGPAIQLLFTPIGFPGLPLAGRLSLSMYTAPALFCCLINVLCILGLRFVFVERYAGLANPQHAGAAERKVVVPPYDRRAVFLCHATRFTQLFAFTNIETLSSPFVMAMFALSSADSVRVLALCHSVSGALGFGVYMGHIFLRVDQRIDYRLVCVLGFVGFVAFHVLTMPWPFVSGRLLTYGAEDYAAFLNETRPEPLGCPRDTFDWCETTAPVNRWVYLVMLVVVLGVLWPNVNVSLSTLLSKILGPRRQAHQQSLFQMSASVARLVGPIAISNLYTSFGPLWAWVLELSVLVVLLAVWALQYGRFVPLAMPAPTELPPVELVAAPIEFEHDDEAEEPAATSDSDTDSRYSRE